MKRILYLMNVPWGWIKQRPHFLAESLGEICQVQVCFPKEYRKSRLVNNDVKGDLRLKEIFRLPFIRFSFIRKINSQLYRRQLQGALAGFDIIWVADPLFYQSIHNLVKPGQMLIYDCMDDWLEFPYFAKNSFYFELVAAERQLVKKSHLIFCSSTYLKGVMARRYGNSPKIHVINNAISLREFDSKSTNIDKLPSHIEQALSSNQVLLAYLGTISPWLDLELIMRSLERFEEISYLLFGPLSGIILPTHERLHYLGPVPHGLVLPILNRADACVMPFKRNKLIFSVNPVKLYEYIYSDRPAIALSYGESQLFADYVYLYEDEEGYFALLQDLIQGNLPPKGTAADHQEFASRNTWESRVAEMMEIIASR